jgi:ABC-type glycerol-3-phosphate transport system substrate-binding protein
MKILYALIGILLLAGCNMSDESDDTVVSQSAVIEYVWQTKGPNYSDEALETLIDSWNQKNRCRRIRYGWRKHSCTKL